MPQKSIDEIVNSVAPPPPQAESQSGGDWWAQNAPKPGTISSPITKTSTPPFVGPPTTARVGAIYAPSYQTKLNPQQENQFQSWVKQNKVPWQDTPNADYDMRGFYKARQSGDPRAKQSDKNLHFPDIWKTPYHQGFSNESIYATPDAPRWEGDRLYDKSGRLIKDETQYPGAVPPNPASITGPPTPVTPGYAPPVPKPPLPWELRTDTQKHQAEVERKQKLAAGVKPDVKTLTPYQGFQAATNIPVIGGVVQAGEGLTEALRATSGPEAAKGITKAIGGGLDAVLPLAGESIMAKPAEAAIAGVTGWATQEATQAGLKKLGIKPEYADLAGSVTGLLSAYAAGKIRLSPEQTTLVETLQGKEVPDQVAKLQKLASDPGTTQGERDAASAMLKKKFNIDHPAFKPAEPSPTPQANAEASPPEVPAPVEKSLNGDAEVLTDEQAANRQQYFHALPDSESGAKQVPISDITTPNQSPAETLGAPMKARDVESYRKMIRNGSEPPPLTGKFNPDTGKIELSDGHRTLEALKAEGRDTAEVNIAGLGEKSKPGTDNTNSEPWNEDDEDPVSGEVITQPEEKPKLHEMTAEELDKAIAEERKSEANLYVDLFGKDGAKRYKSLERIANSTSRPFKETNDAADEMSQMEDKLTKTQSDRLFGITGGGIDIESAKSIRRAIGRVDGSTPEELGDSLKWAVSRFDPQKPEADQEAYAQLKRGFQIAKEQGWNTAEVMAAAYKGVASRFKDPADATFILSKYFTKPKELQSPAETLDTEFQNDLKALTYDQLQKRIDSREDEIEASGIDPTKMYDPKDPRASWYGPEYRPQPEDLARLYRQRDALQKNEDAQLEAGLSERLEKVITDTANRQKFIRELAETDISPSLRDAYNPNKWKEVGRVADLALKFARHEAGDHDSFTEVRAILAGTPDNPGIQLVLSKKHGTTPYPSSKVFDRAQQIFDAIAGDGSPKLPRPDRRITTTGLKPKELQ